MSQFYIHPLWSAMMLVGSSIAFASVTPPVFHSIIDDYHRRILDYYSGNW